MRVRAALLFLLSAFLAPFLHAQMLQETVLYSFGAVPDASGPDSSLIQASDGNFYGTSGNGGAGNSGAVYRISPSGQESVLYSFCTQTGCLDGNTPSSLIQGTDGNLYGICNSGGSALYYGTIFKLTLSGSFTLLHTFTSDAPYYGRGTSLIIGSDGNFYGTLLTSGIFKLTPAGVYSVLYGDNSGSKATNSQLLEASDGFLYGIATYGGFNGAGSIFRVSLAGVYEDLYDFCSLKNCADGTPNEESGYNLVEGSSGILYGTTFGGGVPLDGDPYGEGVFYSFNPTTFAETVLYSFCSADANCSDGARPAGDIFLGGNGILYGNNGGTPDVSVGVNHGDLYSITQAGVHSILYDYLSTESSTNGPTQGSDGNLYDPLSSAGAADHGEISRFPLTTPPVQLGISPASIAPGQSATLTWSVKNAFSKTMQICFASGGWSGLKAISGSVTITPSATTTYALTCGGIESGFAAITVSVPKLLSQTVLTATPNPVAPGTTLSLVATVTGTGGTPTGNVLFSADGATLSTVALVKGVATLPIATTGLPVGAYSLSATYQGDSAYDPSVGGKVVTVANANSTQTVATATPNPVAQGQNVTLSAKVSRIVAGATPTGTVTFSYAGNTLATANLNGSGLATFTVPTSSLPAGIYAITAKYNGDASDATSTSSVNVVIRYATTTTLQASPNPVPPPADLLLTATTIPSGGDTPLGTVTFLFAGNSLGQAALNASGVAQLTLPTANLPAGTYPITATYAGDSDDLASTAAAVNVVVH